MTLWVDAFKVHRQRQVRLQPNMSNQISAALFHRASVTPSPTRVLL
jgi:hypothetical protein